MEELVVNSRGKAAILIVIPTYNENQSIEGVVRRTRAAVPEANILIVDDASPDGTGRIADKIARADTQVEVMHRASKAGLGTAYRAGFLQAIELDYAVIAEMDADGSHQPEELPHLLDALSGADLVLGSRWVQGGGVINWSMHRIALSRFANWYTRRMLGLKIRDVTAGYRAYRRPVLEAIEMDTVTSEGYAFQIELTHRAAAAGFSIVEVPIQFVEREQGKSKMSYAVIAEAMRSVIRWRSGRSK